MPSTIKTQTMRPVYQKRASIMDATPLLKQPIIARTATRVEKMELRHESHLDRFDPPSYSYPRSKYGPRKATDRWREARRSSAAEPARWLPALSAGQRAKAPGGGLP